LGKKRKVMAEAKCPICGSDLAKDLLEGLCPRCVLNEAMKADQTPLGPKGQLDIDAAPVPAPRPSGNCDPQ
jgi:hypothetical protein